MHSRSSPASFPSTNCAPFSRSRRRVADGTAYIAVMSDGPQVYPQRSRHVDGGGGAGAGLNEDQRAAATHGDGPLLIVAGAGTGKTRTLVHRVAHLVDNGTKPERILLL